MKFFYLLLSLLLLVLSSAKNKHSLKKASAISQSTLEADLYTQAQTLIENAKRHSKKQNSTEDQSVINADENTFVEIAGEKVSLANLVEKYSAAKAYCGDNFENCKEKENTESAESNVNENANSESVPVNNESSSEYETVSQNEYEGEEKPLMGRIDPATNSVVVDYH